MSHSKKPFKFIRDFSHYSIVYSAEASKTLGKKHWYAADSFLYFLGEKYSNRYVFVPKGYFTDGATVPFLLQPILPVWGDHGGAVFVHDMLCETGYCLEKTPTGDVKKVPLTRAEIDAIFVEALRVIDYAELRVRLVEAGLKVHRTLANPPSPNPNRAKDAFQSKFMDANGIKNIAEEDVLDYVDNDINFCYG